MQPGHIIADRYRLDEPVAAGGMSDVWSTTDLLLGRQVAVKVILPALMAQPGFAERFRAEARIMAGLEHPGIVTVHDYGQVAESEGETAYLVMALVDGEALSDRLARDGRIDPAETMSIIAQAADALEAAHNAGVVHRDVKPGNLLLRPGGAVVVVDFGVATTAAAAALTDPDEVPGTALYLAPERLTRRDASSSVDIYALGVVAYECLGGTPPFTGDNPVAVAVKHIRDAAPALPADVPEPVRSVVERALAKDPAQRYPSAASLAAAARAVGAQATAVTALPVGQPATTVVRPALPRAVPPTVPVEGPRRSRRRVAVLLGAAAVGTAAAVAAPGVLGVPNTPADRRPPATDVPPGTDVPPSPDGSVGRPGVVSGSGTGSMSPAPTAVATGVGSPGPARSTPRSGGGPAGASASPTTTSARRPVTAPRPPPTPPPPTTATPTERPLRSSPAIPVRAGASSQRDGWSGMPHSRGWITKFVV